MPEGNIARRIAAVGVIGDRIALEDHAAAVVDHRVAGAALSRAHVIGQVEGQGKAGLLRGFPDAGRVGLASDEGRAARARAMDGHASLTAIYLWVLDEIHRLLNASLR